MKLADLLVACIVIAAALFAAWRLAGPVGRLRILRVLAALLAALGARRAAARIRLVHDRLAATGRGSACAQCSPDAHQPRLERRE